MENEHFPGIGEIREFQQGKKRRFSNKTGRSGAKEASYRKVSVYTKSMDRYAKERERRRQVRLLAEKGHTQKQIASELGVSTRTVKRDCDKIRSYVKGQARKEIRQVADEQQQEFKQRIEELTVNKRLKILKQDIKEATKKARAMQRNIKRKELKQQNVHQSDYIFDLDYPTSDGFPRVTAPPEGSFPLSEGISMKFYAIKNGEKKELLNITLSTKTTSPFH